MLLETLSTLKNKLLSMNDNLLLKSIGCVVDVQTGEKYRENIALADKNNTELKYPIIVIHEGNAIEYDAKRFSNDNIVMRERTLTNSKGVEIVVSDINNPWMPYNLNYRIEIICKKRIDLDAVIVWVLQNIHERDILSVNYKDVDLGDLTYDAIVKRGDIVNIDETLSTKQLYRRTFEMKVATLIENSLNETVTQIREFDGVIVETYQK